MHYTTLGSLRVSKICLGTMTWGEQNTEQHAHQQLDYAIDNGVNFIDTAELYPIPARKKTYGLTEQYIGNWLRTRKSRDKVVIASKVVGPHAQDYFRLQPDLDAKGIAVAVEKSLQRLRCDYIDLYQLHWPSRSANFFGQLNYRHRNHLGVPLEESLGALQRLIEQGKIREIGLSNETPWGVMKALGIAKQQGLQPVVSVQNVYNLLNRSFEIGLAEVAIRENVRLLAYSPLAFGVLTGKYQNGGKPQYRVNKYSKQLPRYSSLKAKLATADFIALAKEMNVHPTDLALAFINQQPFVCSNIIGATDMDQLAQNIHSIHRKITPEQLSQIEMFSTQHSNPCP